MSYGQKVHYYVIKYSSKTVNYLFVLTNSFYGTMNKRNHATLKTIP